MTFASDGKIVVYKTIPIVKRKKGKRPPPVTDFTVIHFDLFCPRNVRISLPVLEQEPYIPVHLYDSPAGVMVSLLMTLDTELPLSVKIEHEFVL